MSYELMFQKAIELQNAGALGEAEAIYMKMLQAMPHNSDVWNLLGLIAQNREDNLRAVDCFLSAIKYAPTPFAPHYFNLGLVYKSMNKPAEAREALQKAVQLNSGFKEAWNYLGLLWAEIGENELAVKSFCKALVVDKDYTDALVNLCFYTNDLKALKGIAEDNSKHFEANYKTALLVENIAEKEHYLRCAVETMPERTDGLLALADLLRSKDKFDEALIYYHKVLNLNNNDVQAILGVADIYLAKNELEKAEKYYLCSFKLTTDIAGAYLNYGILLYRQKRFKEALEEYRKAVILSPETPEISYNLALILKETGDFEEALGLMFNAHLKAPQNHIFTINISETLAELFKQNAELALKIAENWQKQEPDNIFSERLLAGMSGKKDISADDVYAGALFDAFAENYDETIAKLEPQIISKFKELNNNLHGKIIDLGCGTGLAGVALHNGETVFDGVDISANMLKTARIRNVYRSLTHQSIADYLQENHVAEKYDMVVAFDVFCYIGDLRKIFEGLKGANVWFSIETADDDRTKSYYLAPNGRYKHNLGHIKQLLSESAFNNVVTYPIVLRKENGEDVLGCLINAK